MLSGLMENVVAFPTKFTKEVRFEKTLLSVARITPKNSFKTAESLYFQFKDSLNQTKKILLKL